MEQILVSSEVGMSTGKLGVLLTEYTGLNALEMMTLSAEEGRQKR
jgi:hypothetical protein